MFARLLPSCWLLFVLALAPLFAQGAATIAPGTDTTTAAAPAAGGTKWALLVAVDGYDNEAITPLKYCVSDAQGVASALQACEGFPAEHIYLMTGADATHVNVIKRLEMLAKRVQPGDTFLFYFAGHGFTREGKNYLATVDADPFSVDTLAVSTVPLDMLRERMAKIAARQTLFFIDACRDDPEKGHGEGDNLRTAAFSSALKQAAGASGNGLASWALFFACA